MANIVMADMVMVCMVMAVHRRMSFDSPTLIAYIVLDYIVMADIVMAQTYVLRFVYLTSWWNLLDLACVISGWIGWPAQLRPIWLWPT